MPRFQGRYRIESARLPGWDYASAGAYFITLCTRGRAHAFGEIRAGVMFLSAIGQTAHRFWGDIPTHFPGVAADAFVVMPDHIHGILIIPPADPSTTAVVVVETRHVASLRRGNAAPPPADAAPPPARFGPLQPGSVSKIVQAYKAAVTRWCRLNGYRGFAWQPRFHDRIIRDERELSAKRRYIYLNPSRWPR